MDTPARLPIFNAPYAPDDAALIRRFVADTELDPAAEARIDERARRYIGAIRDQSGLIGGIEDFLREYSLSTREGLALMVLAEALLRVPDSATQDRLIEDKLSGGDWAKHADDAESWFVLASTWALGLSSHIVEIGDSPDNIVAGVVRRLGQPAVRAATRRAMRILGHHFVLGETISEALKRARSHAERGFRHSYDMLGEGARTAADAEAYFASYRKAIAAIGKSAGKTRLPARPGISVKLSALHPRYEATKRSRVLNELVPRVLALAEEAKALDLGFTVDAEEADRLELSLAVIAAVAANPSLAGWDGFGLAIQAYQKRAPAVIAWVTDLAASLDRRMMVRLVKGAYWDTEIKRAQERGLADYPVFTRKAATDLCYLACARQLLAARPRLYPQFASHNALTVATILEMAGDREGFEFQRLHGMGEPLYEAVWAMEGIPCRIYAPVGGHRELLAYLVRRLLENGANSSFVAIAGDRTIPVDSLLRRPATVLEGGARARHARIPLPANLYAPTRRNSKGMEFGHRHELDALLAGMARAKEEIRAHPLIATTATKGEKRPVISPIDGGTIVGDVVELPVESTGDVMRAAGAGFQEWSRVPATERATILDRMSDLLEGERDALVSLLAREGGKTLNDGVAEVREAVDFCRYYAAEARRLFANGEVMPGPTGERDVLSYRPRGTFVCISPWNFPLAIFMGQVAAALAAGNAVVAKPAEQTPLMAFRVFELLHRAGVSRAAAQLVPGNGKLGAALVAYPELAGVAFTGSTEVGWAINRALAAKNGPIVPLIAETGGINAMIVDATALAEQVCDDVISSAFRSAGQRCSALRLLCLQDEVAEPVIEMIAGAVAELALGDPAEPATDIGPVIDAEAKANLEKHLADLRKARWAKVRYAGSTPRGALARGTYVAPHIVELDSPGRLTREVFGPILHVVRWRAGELDRLTDAIAATGYGLTLGIHTRIDDTARRIVARLPTGNVYVNRNMIGAVVGTQPFGGTGLSGTGPKAGGPDYLRRFALEQVVSTNTAAAGGNASLIAMDDG
ncbi:MAG TPA: bifunctional proline dehydrogenase/L-glutamate gamma-semialdehyde dehydrogenase PutA [Bauldia sp.]|nr:bifunctional proline dehydrogenase/L-glutamate gamma-semialdehyde dehydrogenase PutA [Bauldia sp.]